MKRFLLVLSLPLFLFFHFQTYAQTVNDLCSGAITLTVGVTCNNTLVVKDGTETDSGISNPGCAGYVGADVWYKLVMPASGAVRVETDVDDGSVTDGGMAIYVGADCNNLTLLDCDDNGNYRSPNRFEAISIKQPAGSTIYVRVWEYNEVRSGTFNICAYEISNPADATNDDCIDAIELVVNTTCTPIIGTTSGATPSEDIDVTIPDPGCANYSGNDVWFKLTVPASGNLEVQTYEDAFFGDGGMAIYSGNCNASGLTLLSCNDDGGNIPPSLERIQLLGQTPGETLYVRVWSFGNNEFGTFNICATEITLPSPATNDDCVDAIELTIGATCTSIIGTNSGATNSEDLDATIPSPGCGLYSGGDVWFKVVVPASGNLEIETYEDDLSITDGGMAVYSGTCDPNGLILLACDDDSGLISNYKFERLQILNQIPGETLYIRVWSIDNVVGTFNICASETIPPPPVSNDDCIDAIALTIGVTCTSIIGTNVGATSSEDNDATIPDPGCANYSGNDVWFKVTVPPSGDLAIETYEDDNSITDGGLAVYSGTCNPNGLTLLECNDDGGFITNKNFERVRLTGQNPGDILFIRVWSFNNSQVGTFNICVTEVLSATDDCIDAIELTVGSTCTSIIGSNVGATSSEINDPTIPDPGCANYLGNDVWFKVTVPLSGNLAIETFEDDLSITDGGMAVYSGTCNPNGLTLLECNDGGSFIANEHFERIELLDQTPGDVLYIRIWSYNNYEVGTFNICVTEISPATNDDCIDAIELLVTNSPIIGTNISATPSEIADPTIPGPICGFYGGGSGSSDIWFKVVVPPSGDFAVETFEDDNSITDGAMAIYSGNCSPNGLTQIVCEDNGGTINVNFERIELLGQTPGETLYVRVWSPLNSEIGTFNIFARELNALGVEDEAINNFTMYPNPAKDLVNINFNKGLNGNMTIDIFDIQGKRVLSKKSLDIVDKIALNISNLKSGLYFVKLKNGQQETTRKLIVE